MATSASPDPTGLEKTTGLSDAKKSFPSLDSLDTAMNQMQFAAAEPAAIGTTHGAAVRISTAGIEVSMGSVGDCYDNAVCETFHASHQEREDLPAILADPRRGADRRLRATSRAGTTRAAGTRPRLSVPDRFRATPRRARPTGWRPDFSQRIGRDDLAEGLRGADNASRFRRSASISLPTAYLSEKPSSSQPVPLRPRQRRSRDERQRVA